MEKLRRDRINSSIKQLRLLLESNLQSHQPNAKLEKADILELTVNYLKQRHHLVNETSTSTKRPFQDFGQGYNRCLEETLQYLSYTEKMGHANHKILQYFNMGKAPDAAAPAYEQPSKQVIWRPW